MVATFVRPGAVLADVGTDHGYLPIHLLLCGGCRRAVATDIHKGPLTVARENGARYGVADRMSFYLTDGLSDIDLAGEGVTDIAICGMGGEMIADILKASPYTKEENVRLILQPMSSLVDLRTYLAGAGYCIQDEQLTVSEGRVYTCLLVQYDGVLRTPTPLMLLLGEAHIERGTAAGEAFSLYLSREYEKIQKQYAGRKRGGLSVSLEEELLSQMEELAAACGVGLSNKKKEE